MLLAKEVLDRNGGLYGLIMASEKASEMLQMGLWWVVDGPWIDLTEAANKKRPVSLSLSKTCAQRLPAMTLRCSKSLTSNDYASSL